MSEIAAATEKRPKGPGDYWHIGPVYIQKMVVLALAILVSLAILTVFGLPTGFFTTPGGAVTPTYRYDDPRLADAEGLVRVLDHSGTLRYEGEVSGGSYTGWGTVYDAYKQTVYIGPLVDGRYEGPAAKVFQNKVLVYEGEMAGGAYEGQGRRTDPESGVVSEGHFSKGLFDGEGKESDKSETLLREGMFARDLLEGEGREYGPQGVLLREGSFSAGFLNGEGSEYTPQGTLRYEGQFRRGVYQGQGKLYDAYQKALCYEGTFTDGVPTGEGTIFHPSGQWLYRGTVYDGQPRADAFLGLSLSEVEAAFSEHWLVYSLDGVTAFVYPTFHLMFITESPVDIVSPSVQEDERQQEREEILDAFNRQTQLPPQEEAVPEETVSTKAGILPVGYFPLPTGTEFPPDPDSAEDELLAPDTDKKDVIICEVLSYGDSLAGVAQPKADSITGVRDPGWREWFCSYAMEPGTQNVLTQHTGQFIYRFTPASLFEERPVETYCAEGGGVLTTTVWRAGKDPTVWYQSAVRKEET